MKSKLFPVLSLTVLNLTSCNTYSYNKPISKEKQSIKIPDKTDIAIKTIENLAPYLLKSDENTVISPSSYALAIGALLSVSDNIEELKAKNGFTSSELEQTRDLLESLNWSINKGKNYIKSAVLLMQVGSQYEFDSNKVKEVEKNHIAVAKEEASKATDYAQDFFKDNIGLEIKIPDVAIDDSVMTFAAIKMLDKFEKKQSEDPNKFTVNGVTKTVDTYEFENSELYYKGKNYTACNVTVRETKNLIILPDVGVKIEDINLKEAYSEFMSKAEHKAVVGYLPYFKTSSTFDMTPIITNQVSGKEVFFSKLLSDSVVNDIAIQRCIQGSDYSFTPTGSKGESFTYFQGKATAAPADDPIEFKVDRPFYSISTYDSFPLFVSKVVNPSL